MRMKKQKNRKDDNSKILITLCNLPNINKYVCALVFYYYTECRKSLWIKIKSEFNRSLNGYC